GQGLRGAGRDLRRRSVSHRRPRHGQDRRARDPGLDGARAAPTAAAARGYLLPDDAEHLRVHTGTEAEGSEQQEALHLRWGRARADPDCRGVKPKASAPAWAGALLSPCSSSRSTKLGQCWRTGVLLGADPDTDQLCALVAVFDRHPPDESDARGVVLVLHPARIAPPRLP